ncbi:MAG: hypothetical protein JNM88_06360 [Chitinophagaceae bacterium]|nr:hypothetical protein [Chitinophagaceae bacterium]
MSANYKRWRLFFLFCLGLALGTTFCMKWLEGDFVYSGGPFTIIGLEITYPKEKIMEILTGLNDHVRYLLTAQLYYDFIFMAGIYPGIAALCMMGRYKTRSATWRNILLWLAILQAVAFACDFAENVYLLEWIKAPSSVSDLGVYHTIVYAKWLLALIGAVFGIIFSIRRRYPAGN